MEKYLGGNTCTHFLFITLINSCNIRSLLQNFYTLYVDRQTFQHDKKYIKIWKLKLYLFLFYILLTELSAPLALKDPVFCRFSDLKNAFLPIKLLKVVLVKISVLWTNGLILSCALYMSSIHVRTDDDILKEEMYLFFFLLHCEWSVCIYFLNCRYPSREGNGPVHFIFFSNTE